MMRSISDMIELRHAPIAPNASAEGLPLVALDRDCRFPVAHDGEATRFCAAPVEDWMPGFSGGCYCEFHRCYLRGQPSVFEGDAA